MKPMSIEEFRRIIQRENQLIPRGGASKSGLLRMSNGAAHLDTTGLSGIIEYDPNEYTFTALAGTRVEEIVKTLEENGQYLPFDPPFLDRGATLGGTVASGLSGPGRYRYGGVRDFIIGVKFLNGEGELIQGGGKVVKNAAGFDFPKLMVGSLGQYGILVELSFKVFPRPRSFTTIRREFHSLEDSLSSLYRLTSAPIDVYAIELVPDDQQTALLVRLGGKEDSFPARVKRVQAIIPDGEVVSEEFEISFWQTAREFTWLDDGYSLVKVPITPKRMVDFDRWLADRGAVRRYSVGGNVAWVGWPEEVEQLDKELSSLELTGLVILGEGDKPIIGTRTGQSFAIRVKKALDPQDKWVEV